MEARECKIGDKVEFECEAYMITHVFNHGGDLVYYDLEAKSDLGSDYKKKQYSVHYSQVKSEIELL